MRRILKVRARGGYRSKDDSLVGLWLLDVSVHDCPGEFERISRAVYLCSRNGDPKHGEKGGGAGRETSGTDPLGHPETGRALEGCEPSGGARTDRGADRGRHCPARADASPAASALAVSMGLEESNAGGAADPGRAQSALPAVGRPPGR